MKKTILLFALILPSFALCFAQDSTSVPKAKSETNKKSSWDWDNVYMDGGLGLWFDQYGSIVNISPQFGYKLTDDFSVGAGITYMHISNKYYSPPINFNIYGGSIFGRYLITDFLFLHAEYQPLNANWKFPYNKRFFINNVWLGGGLRQQSGNSSFSVIGLWNVNDEGYIQNPQIRIGFGIGF